MGIRIYSYLREQNIGIEGSERLLDRIEGNIDEKGEEKLKYEGIVRVFEGDIRKIVRDKTAEYISIRENKKRDIDGWDYMRYKTHVQTIWRKNSLEYEVENHLSNDETGALRCFKRIYYNLPGSKDKTLLHASAVDIGQSGVLIVGKKRTGKTTLAFNMVDKLGASLVEGGNSLISFKGKLRVYYLPRPIFARFFTISESPYLYSLFDDIESSETQQPWDLEAIRDVIKSKSFSIDGGLNFSRRAFRRLSGKDTLQVSAIKSVIFPSYSNQKIPKINSISIEEAYPRMLDREFKIYSEFGNFQDQDNPEHSQEPILSPEWLEGLKLKTVSFDGNKNITNSLLEDLIS